MVTKGVASGVYEEYFNIAPNSSRSPDFALAGIELKTTGLRLKVDGSVGQKERLSLTMMGRFNPAESWQTSHLRSKLDRLLIIYFGYREGEEIGSFPTLRVVRWSPSPDEEALLRRDWDVIQETWSRGDDLSDRLTDVLTASTKGGAKSFTRAYALKPRFNFSIYEVTTRLASLDSLASFLKAPTSFEDAAVKRLRSYAGRSVADIRQSLGIRPSTALNAQATVIRAIVGLRPRRSWAEYERTGLSLKTVPISPSGRTLERMSFPAFNPLDLVGAEWEESDLLAETRKLILVPLVRAARATPRDEATMGRAFLWQPSESLLREIQAVWEAYRDRVAAGRPDDYPRKSDGLPIFVNSHGKDGRDMVNAPNGLRIARRSFWLHPDIVEPAVTGSSPSWRGS